MFVGIGFTTFRKGYCGFGRLPAGGELFPCRADACRFERVQYDKPVESP